VERRGVFCEQIQGWKARIFGTARLKAPSYVFARGVGLVCRADQLRLQAGVIEGIAVVTGAIVVLNMQLDGASLHCHESNQQIANPDGVAGHEINVVERHGKRRPVSEGSAPGAGR